MIIPDFPDSVASYSKNKQKPIPTSILCKNFEGSLAGSIYQYY